jgi:glutamate synthase (NADPH/NADH) small chain
MGQPTGFLEFSRTVPEDRLPRERVTDFGEFHKHLPEATLREQGARCMDCGVPFCHTGKIIDGLASGCPLHNLIPEWNDLVYRGRWREAIDRLHRTNNFPEVTGRAWNQRPPGHHQGQRGGHCRSRFRRRLGRG